MYHPAQTLSFGLADPKSSFRRRKPSVWRRLLHRLMAWRRPSTAVVLHRLAPYRR